MKTQIIIIILILSSLFFIYPEDKQKSLELYTIGIEKIDSGDIEGAITNLKEAISLDERNFKAKKSLVDALLIKAKKLISEAKFNDASILLKEAYRIFPSNKEVADLNRGLSDGTIQQQYTISNNQEEEVTQESNTHTNTTKNEVVSRSKEAEKNIEEIKKQVFTSNESSTKENQNLLKELNEQKKLIEKMRINYESMSKSNDSATSKKDTDTINQLIKVYKTTLENANKNDGKDNTAFLVEQMKQQRELMESQKKESRQLIIIIFAATFGLILFIIIIIIVLIAFFINRANRLRKNSSYYNGFSPTGMGYNKPMQLSSNDVLRIGFDPASNDDTTSTSNEDEMYKDLIRSERLKRMHSQMKSGELNWNTVREYIFETEKELRNEILNIVEMKILSGELIDGSNVLPILFPYLTEGDDYLREKANSLVKKALTSTANTNNQEKMQLTLSSKGLDYKQRLDEQHENDIEDIISHNVLDIKNLLSSLQELENVFGNKERSLETAKIAKGMALTLGMAKGDVELLYKTSIAHDFGYLMMDKERLQTIMYKTDISEEDFQFIQDHTSQGITFFKSYIIPQEMKDGIFYHHERNDGSGYPEGLKGEEIPLFAKIIGLAETFVAITSARPHKDKLSPNEAVAIIRDGARKKFDIQHIDALTNYLKKVGIIKK